MHIGIIGLGRMGLNMARRLHAAGHTVIAHNKTPEKIKAAEAEGIKGAYSIKDLCSSLPKPKTIWLMIPAGKPVDDMIGSLKGLLSEGDTIVDGGNSFYKDAVRRHKELKGLKIDFLDAGVSGGIWGLKNGYCIMAGGERAVFDRLTPALKDLAAEKAYMFCGGPGAGHFVKMAHNAIEYGMMEAYAEGFELLKSSEYGDIDLAEVSGLWMRGSVVRSWLLELLEAALRKDSDLSSIAGYVEDSGEGRWSVMDAVERGVNLPVITASLFRRFRSRQDESFGEKILAAMRAEFGGHAVKAGKKTGDKE